LNIKVFETAGKKTPFQPPKIFPHISIMDNTPVLNHKQLKQYMQMLTYFNNGFKMNESIFSHLYVFRHPDVHVPDKVLLLDRQTMDFYTFNHVYK
jgi:hypothetical protein